MNTSEKFQKLRQEAEAILHKARRAASDDQEPELIRLVHELEVHQIELQLQNEELRAVSAELEMSRNLYEELYDFAPVGYVTVDLKGIVAHANLMAGEMLGYLRRKLIGRRFSMFIHPRDYSIYFGCIQQIAQEKGMKHSCELRLIARNGALIPVQAEICASREDREHLTGWRIAFMDVSRQKRAEESLQESEKQLRHLSRRLLAVQEEERKRIARELHDSIGQMLAAMKFNVEGMLQEAKSNPEELVQLLEHLVPRIQQTMEETRAIYMGLRPSILDDLGIVVTLNWMGRQFLKHHPRQQIEMKVDIEENEIPENLKIVIFRIAQEALNNVIKHSRAERVLVGLTKVNERIQLTIRDDGQGFDVAAAFMKKNPQRGMGLGSMKERTELSGGCFSIESVLGEGTTVQALWPCEVGAPGQ